MGVDFTARDLQQRLKEKREPWEKAKSFDNSAPIGRLISKDRFLDINNINFTLFKNKKQVQSGNTKDMIFKIDEIISYVSKFITLKKGDLIFTGTPDGVGKVEKEDILEGYIENEKILDFKVK